MFLINYNFYVLAILSQIMHFPDSLCLQAWIIFKCFVHLHLNLNQAKAQGLVVYFKTVATKYRPKKSYAMKQTVEADK